ncbi:MAG TPA: DUF6036 family nucleotidyltransferase [Thermoanaerobaculia bacterium]|jgi:hypothetical protein
MKRDELEHVLRAAGAITGVTTWVIVGSQAILGAVPDAPAELLVSQEVDLYAPGDERASDLLDGSIGERSPFHDSFGYYGHGVGAETAVLPSRWRERALTIETPATGGVKAICPEPHDLAISKLVAGREKDRDYVRSLLAHGIVDPNELSARASELAPELAARVASHLRTLTTRN